MIAFDAKPPLIAENCCSSVEVSYQVADGVEQVCHASPCVVFPLLLMLAVLQVAYAAERQ
jgi:hypothetical protein